MNKKAILYSIEDISISQIKKKEKIILDKVKEKSFLHYCNKYNIKSLVGDEVFLKKTKPIPYIVYYMWDYSLLEDKKIIWIVWPRKITDFIRSYLDYLFQHLSSNVAIISWLAEGTDQYAHKLALKYNIPTIWVLWFGIAKALNGKERYLIQDIKDNNWLILSQFPLKQHGTHWTFPVRNKIIAWVSDLLFVPQAREKSWSLITVEEAIKFDNPVYSCLSSIQDDMWKWTNKLIADNKIKWIYDMDVFIENLKKEYNLHKKESNFSKLSEKEQLVCKSIKEGYDTLETICFHTKKSTDDILNILSMLELEWIISFDGERYFLY